MSNRKVSVSIGAAVKNLREEMLAHRKGRQPSISDCQESLLGWIYVDDGASASNSGHLPPNDL